MKARASSMLSGATWMEDGDTDKCLNPKCSQKFTMLGSRKHHCRYCGKIFCDKCSRDLPVVYSETPTQLLTARKCNFCRVPKFFYANRWGGSDSKLDAKPINIILSYLDDRSTTALIQSHPQIKHHFHARDVEYYQSLQDRFPTLYAGAQVGRGACGTVYKVEDWKQDNNKVAVKVCEKSAVHTYHSWKKLFAEIAIMRNNDHVNVSKLYEVFQTPTQLVMVVELGEGGSLKRAFEVVKRKGLDVEVFTANVVGQVAAGLDYLYSVRHLVHRDIKQDNIVLSKDFSRVMVIDFGLAEFIRNEKSQKYVPCGTMGFASPENILAVVERKTAFEATGLTMHAADLFSLGVVAYTLLSGQKPLKGKFGEMHQDVKKGLKCLGRHWTTVSSNAKHIVEWMLVGPTLQRALPEDIVNHRFIIESIAKFPSIGDNIANELVELEKVEEQEWVFVANRMNISQEWLDVCEEDIPLAEQDQ